MVLESVLVSFFYNWWPETIKLLEESIGKTLSDINHSSILYDPPSRVMEIIAKINKKESEIPQSCLTLCDPMDTRLLCPWDFLGKNTGVYCHFLLQSIFLTQGSNPGLLHCRQMLYHLSHQWNLIKLKTFCTMKETISKGKRQPSESEKLIANETTDKELISKIYKQLMQLNSRKINYPIKKWAKELNKYMYILDKHFYFLFSLIL